MRHWHVFCALALSLFTVFGCGSSTHSVPCDDDGSVPKPENDDPNLPLVSQIPLIFGREAAKLVPPASSEPKVEILVPSSNADTVCSANADPELFEAGRTADEVAVNACLRAMSEAGDLDSIDWANHVVVVVGGMCYSECSDWRFFAEPESGILYVVAGHPRPSRTEENYPPLPLWMAYLVEGEYESVRTLEVDKALLIYRGEKAEPPADS